MDRVEKGRLEASKIIWVRKANAVVLVAVGMVAMSLLFCSLSFSLALDEYAVETIAKILWWTVAISSVFLLGGAVFLLAARPTD